MAAKTKTKRPERHHPLRSDFVSGGGFLRGEIIVKPAIDIKAAAAFDGSDELKVESVNNETVEFVNGSLTVTGESWSSIKPYSNRCISYGDFRSYLKAALKLVDFAHAEYTGAIEGTSHYGDGSACIFRYTVVDGEPVYEEAKLLWHDGDVTENTFES